MKRSNYSVKSKPNLKKERKKIEFIKDKVINPDTKYLLLSSQLYFGY